MTTAGDRKPFRKYADAGFQANVIPIIPLNADLDKSSKLSANDLGKIPGRRLSSGKWTGRKGWTKEAITPKKVRTWDKWQGAGIGIRTGKVVGIDIDIKDKSLAEKIEALAVDLLGPAPCRIGNAPKRLLPYRTETPRGKKSRSFVHNNTGEVHKLEILGTGQQFIVEGIHPKTKRPYEWHRGNLTEVGFDGLTEVASEQVDVFLGAACDLMENAGYLVTEKQSSASGNRMPIGHPSLIGDPELVRMALKLIGNELEYDDWITLVAAIKAALGGDLEHYEIYEDWCLLYDGNDHEVAKAKWDSVTDAEIGIDYIIGIAKKIAEELDDFDFLQTCEAFEFQRIAEEFDVIDNLKETPDCASDGDEVCMAVILNPPGLVGEIAAYHDANSLRVTPLFGVAAGLAVVSILAANNYVFTPEVGPPSSTNLYIMGVGATGVGKEQPRTVIKYNLHLVDAIHLDVDAASEPALLRHLMEYPNGIWLKDEIGRHLEFAANPNGGHQYALITALTSLYGLALSSTSRRTYSKGKDTIPAVPNPYMTIFSTSTRESLAKALNSSAVVDGTLNRFIVIHDPNVKPKFQDKPYSVMSDELEGKIKKFYEDGKVVAVANEFDDGPDDVMVKIRGRLFVPIKPGDGVMDILLAFREYADDKRSEGTLNAPLWARAYENALRVASVVALGDSDPKHPVMTTEHAEWAITFIRWAIGNSIRLMDNVSDNDVERVSKEIENFVHEVIENPDPKFVKYNRDGRVPKSQITRRFRTVRSLELSEHLKTLVEAGLLKQETAKSSGRSTTIFKPSKRR
jgi:hypothetical protein